MGTKNNDKKAYKSKTLEDFFEIKDPKAFKRVEKNMMLALRILKAMESKGMNRVQFAAKLNINPSVVTKWLSGTHNFTTETLFDIEEALNISLLNIEQNDIQLVNKYQVNLVLTTPALHKSYFQKRSQSLNKYHIA